MLRVENVIRSNRGCYDISYCGGFEWKRQNEFRANTGPTKDNLYSHSPTSNARDTSIPQVCGLHPDVKMRTYATKYDIFFSFSHPKTHHAYVPILD